MLKHIKSLLNMIIIIHNTVEAIRQSLPVSIAISLLNGDLNIDNLDINPKIISLASKVVLENDKEMEGLYPSKRPSRVKY